jgi:hypothetical protein
MDHPKVNSTTTVVEFCSGHAEAWEFSLSAGFAVDEARRSAFHHPRPPTGEATTQNGARHASER